MRVRQTAHFRKACLTALLGFAPFILPLDAIAQTVPEPDLKAAIIANMLLFVEWPTDNAPLPDHLTICHIEANPVTEALGRLNGKSIKGKTLKVVRARPDNLNDCLAVYLPPGNIGTLNAVAAKAGSSAILLMGDSQEYLGQGIMLNLELISGRVVFDIDLRSAQRKGLKVSSKALRLARQVIE